MEIELRMRGEHRADWLPRLRTRLHAALRRFRDALARVLISLDDVNGPRGGVDKRCRLTLAMRDGRRLHIRHQTDHWQSALAHALERAAQTLRRRHARDVRGLASRASLRPSTIPLNGVAHA